MIKTIKGCRAGYKDVNVIGSTVYCIQQDWECIALDARMARELHDALGEMIAAADKRKAEDEQSEARHEAPSWLGNHGFH